VSTGLVIILGFVSFAGASAGAAAFDGAGVPCAKYGKYGADVKDDGSTKNTCDLGQPKTSPDYGALCSRTSVQKSYGPTYTCDGQEQVLGGTGQPCEVLGQQCDGLGMADGATLCAKWGNPMGCCIIPKGDEFVDLKLVCSDSSGFTEVPTNMTFSNCNFACTKCAGSAKSTQCDDPVCRQYVKKGTEVIQDGSLTETCNSKAPKDSNKYGSRCMRTRSTPTTGTSAGKEIVAQSCDGTLCDEQGNPESCCTIKATGQKLVCSDKAGFASLPAGWPDTVFDNCDKACSTIFATQGIISGATHLTMFGKAFLAVGTIFMSFWLC